MAFIDVHCHLEMCRKGEEAAKRAAKAGVIAITQGVNPKSNRKALEFAAEFENVRAALGGYPTDMVKMSNEEIDREIDFIRKSKRSVAAIGEVGLDLKEGNRENFERQKKIFSKFVELAKELDIPVIVHSRGAEAEAIEILEHLGAKKAIMHCFNGNFGLIARVIRNGWHLSMPTNITFSKHFQKVADFAGIDRLFCETDSPYLHPEKGKRDNEPANVVFAYKKIAEIKGISLKEAEARIEDNYKKLFGAGKA
jgi:TatD DNase family protein